MGLPLCRVCYCFLNGLSRAKLTTLIKKYRQKDKSCTRKEGSGRRTSPKMLSAQFWFKELIRMVGEPSPQSDLVYLPPAHKEDYYREYKDERIEAERYLHEDVEADVQVCTGILGFKSRLLDTNQAALG